MQPCASSMVLVLLSVIGYAPPNANGYLLNTWTAQDLAMLGASVYGSKCYLIPDNLTLCYGIGYDRMRLPNHLNHDTMAEAITQSQIWLALTRTNCHDDLRVFLCSMYAPVCLSEPTKLKPCRSLCENVRQGCLPRMQAVGYEWPDILRCDQFPQADQLCVPPRANTKAACYPCRQAVTYENIISSHCLSSVVFKGRITRYVDQSNRIHLVLHRKKKFYKTGGLSRAARRNLDAFIVKTNGCSCNPLRNTQPQDKWLIMGRRVGSQVKIILLISWQRRNKAFKKAIRSIRRRKNICNYQIRGSGKKRGEDKSKRKKKKKKKKNKNGRRRQSGRRRRVRNDRQPGGGGARDRGSEAGGRRRGRGRNRGSRRGNRPPARMAEAEAPLLGPSNSTGQHWA